MSVSYEWHKPTATEKAVYIDAEGLRELTDDSADITDTTWAVSFDDGGGGAIVYGEPAVLLAYYSRIVSNLAQHVAKMEPVKLADPAMVDSLDPAGLYDLQRQIAAALDTKSKDGFAAAVREALDDSGEIEAELLPTAIVEFSAQEYDDGWFYSSGAIVLNDVNDPDPTTVSFDDTVVEDMLRELSSVRRHGGGLNSASFLRVNLADGSVKHLSQP